MTMAPSPARPRRIGGRVLSAFSATGTVTSIEPAAAHLRRIRIEGDDVARLDWVPGQQVRVHTTDLLDPHNWRRPRDILRTYSVWRYDGGLELVVLDHDTGGPGARWARELQTGQLVTFSHPEGSFVLRDDAPYHVFVGEETASVAFGAMLAALPAGTPVYPVLEVARPDGHCRSARTCPGCTGTAGPRSRRPRCWRPPAGSNFPASRAPSTWLVRPVPFSCCAATSCPNGAGPASRFAASRSGPPASAAWTDARRARAPAQAPTLSPRPPPAPSGPPTPPAPPGPRPLPPHRTLPPRLPPRPSSPISPKGPSASRRR